MNSNVAGPVSPLTRYHCILLAIAAPSLLFPAAADLRSTFLIPPPESRIMMRWWWFGPAVERTELTRELKVMRDAGIGGVEIQPVYPLQLDGNRPYLSPEFLGDLSFTARTARSLGLRVDVTLGSGWPYGGPKTPVTEASSRLRCDRVPLTGNEASVPIPALENGEKFIAAFLASSSQRLAVEPSAARVKIPAGSTGTLLFFIASRTGQQVKRASVGAEGFVLDHHDSQAVQHHLTNVASKLLSAFGDHPPTSVFSDSLEVFSTDWTPDFLPQFKARRGYDLEPELTALASDTPTPRDRAIRHDWALTLAELAEERYLTPIHKWAQAHHTQFRSQTYGEPPVFLSSNRLVDLPEGEAGPRWRTASTARWASSASHLYRQRVTSTETWTWLHSPAFRATPLDMKAEADLHFLQGINQLIGHGWPYSPPTEPEPGYRFYAAAAFNEHNPWFIVMPEVTAYLQRLSWLLRQGYPANDLAVYLPTDDALAASRLGKVTVDRQLESLLDPALIPAILDAGYNFDFIDDMAIQQGKLSHKVLILPGLTRMPLATLDKLREYKTSGGRIVSSGRLPDTAPGFADFETQSAKVAAAARAVLPAATTQLAKSLHDLLQPDFAVDQSASSSLGFMHRKLPDADVYFIANTTNHQVTTKVNLRARNSVAEAWDPFNGKICRLQAAANSLGGAAFALALEPYQSQTVVLSGRSSAASCESATGVRPALNLDAGWNVSFDGGTSASYDQLHSWTDDTATRFYSGAASYERSISLDDPARDAILDFGPGQTIADTAARNAPGMRALLESPVREAAVVYVNGQRAGSVWLPPYALNIGPYLHAGTNTLRIVLANTAINAIAGRALPDYRLLNQRFGERFVPQGFEKVEPLPSGILPGLHLR